jgi:small-conductance mechanosensitive channel
MELLGLTTIVRVLDVVFSYLPHVVSALLIFVFGVLIAGVVESLVKGAVRTVDVHSSRMFAKIASYLVVAIASLAAVSELGIASEFIRILFVGMVFALSLGLGLSFGLGGQDVVRKMMDRWYSKSQE